MGNLVFFCVNQMPNHTAMSKRRLSLGEANFDFRNKTSVVFEGVYSISLPWYYALLNK